MTRDDINKMWLQSQDDAEGMRLGFTTQQHYFAALVAAAECAPLADEIDALRQDGSRIAVENKALREAGWTVIEPGLI